MIIVVDYGMGNLRSVSKAFEIQGFKISVTNNPNDIATADGLVLPGVGAFGDCIANLKKGNLIEPIKEFINRGKPFLGICLGLQALFEESEESKSEKGLGIFSGRVVKFPANRGLKVPHMGWNQISFDKKPKLLSGIPENTWFYFVHSYYVSTQNSGLNLVKSDYGIEFTAAVEKDNVFACQFHPEKSSDSGLKILKNFGGLCS